MKCIPGPDPATAMMLPAVIKILNRVFVRIIAARRATAKLRDLGFWEIEGENWLTQDCGTEPAAVFRPKR